MDNINYLNLITSEYRDKPNFVAWVSSNLGIIDGGVKLAESFINEFDLDTAIGKQLDIIGDILGQPRTIRFDNSNDNGAVLTDDQYRTLLKIKTILNLWKGSIGQLNELWNVFFDDSVQVTDNQDMTMTVDISSNPSVLLRSLMQIIGLGVVVPKPEAVGIKYNLNYERKFDLYVGSSMIESGTDNLRLAIPVNDSRNDLYVGSSIIESGTDNLNLRIDTEFNPKLYIGGLSLLDGGVDIIGIREGEI